jgi:predicted ribosomally synthesized peptide with nif11-like leader
LEKVAADEELQAKMQKATNPDEAYAIASAVQDGFSKEEFVEVMQALNAQNANELSEDDLNKVAGGKLLTNNNRCSSLNERITTNNSVYSTSYVPSVAKSAAV